MTCDYHKGQVSEIRRAKETGRFVEIGAPGRARNEFIEENGALLSEILECEKCQSN